MSVTSAVNVAEKNLCSGQNAILSVQNWLDAGNAMLTMLE